MKIMLITVAKINYVMNELLTGKKKPTDQNEKIGKRRSSDLPTFQ